MKLGPNDLRALAEFGQEQRERLPAVAEFLDAVVSAELEGEFLERELARDLARHHGRLRREEGDPFPEEPDYCTECGAEIVDPELVSCPSCGEPV